MPSGHTRKSKTMSGKQRQSPPMLALRLREVLWVMALGKAAEPALSDFGRTSSRAAAAIGDLFGGSVSTTPASVDRAEKENP